VHTPVNKNISSSSEIILNFNGESDMYELSILFKNDNTQNNEVPAEYTVRLFLEFQKNNQSILSF
jgi:hypothetical protein